MKNGVFGITYILLCTRGLGERAAEICSPYFAVTGPCIRNSGDKSHTSDEVSGASSRCLWDLMQPGSGNFFHSRNGFLL